METNVNKSQDQLPLYFFGLLGVSCFACCAIFSLIIGIGWLATSTNYIFNFGWEYMIPIYLIIWGLLPIIVGYYFYQRKKRQAS